MQRGWGTTEKHVQLESSICNGVWWMVEFLNIYLSNEDQLIISVWIDYKIDASVLIAIKTINFFQKKIETKSSQNINSIFIYSWVFCRSYLKQQEWNRNFKQWNKSKNVLINWTQNENRFLTICTVATATIMVYNQQPLTVQSTPIFLAKSPRKTTFSSTG